jgi:hypothetical protein
MYADGGSFYEENVYVLFKNKNGLDRIIEILNEYDQHVNLSDKIKNEGKIYYNIVGNKMILFSNLSVEKIIDTAKTSGIPIESFSKDKNKYNNGGSMYADGGNTGRVKVGVFSEADLRSGADKKAIEKAQKQTGLTYIDNKVIKKGGKMFMEVYLVPTEEYLNSDKFEHGGSMYADGGNMFETPIAKYKEVSGKVVGSVPVSEEVYSSQVKDFVEYVYEVYEDYGFTKKQVKEAVDKYIKELGYQFTWGGGDSLDRERVYEYLRNPNLQGIKNPSFANGGSMSKSYEIGDIISFNSVMGGTKTGAIVSKLGEDGFRIKTEDGFATVKKSAIV